MSSDKEENTVIPNSSLEKKKGVVAVKHNARHWPASIEPIPCLLCYGCADDLPIESYLFWKDDRNDIFFDRFRRFADGTIVSAVFEDHNYTSSKARRIHQSKMTPSLVSNKDTVNSENLS